MASWHGYNLFAFRFFDSDEIFTFEYWPWFSGSQMPREPSACIVFPRFMHFLIARRCSCEFQFEKICDLKIDKCDSKNLTNKNFGLWCLFGFSFEYSLCSLFVCLVTWLLFCQMGQLDRPRTLYFWRYNTHSTSTNLSKSKITPPKHVNMVFLVELYLVISLLTGWRRIHSNIWPQTLATTTLLCSNANYMTVKMRSQTSYQIIKILTLL